MECNIQDLMMIIGQQTVEINMLQKQLAAIKQSEKEKSIKADEKK